MKSEALVILSPGFAANEDDTVCLTPMQTVVRALQAQYPSVQVIIITFQYPFKTRAYTWHNVKVFSLGGKDWGKGFRLITWGWAVWRFSRLNKLYHIKGILTFWLGECALVGDYLSRTYRVKHFIWLLGQDARPGNRFFNRIQPKADNLIALSDFLHDTFSKNYHIDPRHTIPLGVNPRLYGKAAENRTIDLMAAGSLIPLKQYDVFVETVRYLTYFIPNISAVICGKGPEHHRLQELINDYDLRNNIQLLGEVPHNEVIGLMQQSRVFLHPSCYEGFGSVITEALYAGAHVVSFYSPMHAIAAHHHVVDRIPTMQQKVLRLLKDETLDHEPVLLFSADDIAKRVMSLYEQTPMITLLRSRAIHSKDKVLSK